MKMKKRGQISVFLIFGLLIIVSGWLYFHAKSTAASGKSQTSVVTGLSDSDSQIVTVFAESCIKIAAEDALFNKIGIQGGYLEVAGTSTKFLGNNIPFYLQADCQEDHCAYSKNIPALNTISSALSSNILAKFEKCFNTETFSDIGIEISKHSTKNADISLNKEDITIKLNYPLTIKKGTSETDIDSFSVNLPIRLKALHDGSEELISKIVSTPSGKYTITKNDCNSFDKNGITNVYIKTSDDNNKIIQFVDFSTYYEKYANSFIFQFAVKNIDITGGCTG